jgi:hypothetical protein
VVIRYTVMLEASEASWRASIPDLALSVVLWMAVLTRSSATAGPASLTVPRIVQAGCDAALSAASRTPGVTIKRSVGPFRDEVSGTAFSGCRLLIVGSFAKLRGTDDASLRLRRELSASGWHEMPEYDADGKDGTAFALRKGEVTCLVRGQWNGGADGVPEEPGEDWYRVEVGCTNQIR